jgi:hypothetical protein
MIPHRYHSRSPGCRRCPRRRPRAFTLMEMVTSCLIVSLLMLTVGYGLKLALLSAGNGALQASASLEGTDIVERITDDLNEATNFTEKTATAVTFTVPDRDGDAAKTPEKIRYQWWPTSGTYTISSGSTSGSSGGGAIGGLLGTVSGVLGGGTTTDANGNTVVSVPQYTLTRQLNDGDLSVLARDVRQFGLSYLYRSMSPPPVTASTERLLLPSSEPIALGPGYKETGISTNSWMGATFQPSQHLPAGTTSITISKVQFYLRSSPSTDGNMDGVLQATIRTTSGGQPPLAGGLIAGATSRQVPEMSLQNIGIQTSSTDDIGWVDFTFANPVTLTFGSTTRYCVVLQAVSGGTGNSAYASYLAPTTILLITTPLSPTPSSYGAAFVTWNGSSWSNTGSSIPRFKIWGTSN